MTHDTPHATDTFDLAALVHKALRGCLFDTLLQVGRVDAGDAGQLRACAWQVRQLLALCGETQPALHAAVDRLGQGPLEQRAMAAQTLYQALSQWTLQQLQRMAEDEAAQAGQLPPRAQAAARLAALSDAELREALHWMGRSLGPQELAALLGLLQPAEGARFGLALQALDSAVDGAGWDGLARAMGLPTVTLPAMRPALSLAA